MRPKAIGLLLLLGLIMPLGACEAEEEETEEPESMRRELITT